MGKLRTIAGENQLLALLPRAERAALEAAATTVRPPIGEMLFAPRARISRIYFPVDGVYSIVVKTRDRIVIEVATVGREGMLGTPRLLGVDHYDATVMCQIPGTLRAVDAARFMKLVGRSPKATAIFHRYLQTHVNFVAQSAVCNRAHRIERRCARWLLLTHDRADGDEFYLTHEFLAQMLGVRRASVSVVANALQDAGYISYRRGRVRIRDRRRLERFVCDCYAAIRDNYEELMLGAAPSRRGARR
ncbi:MAG TPA: Crp/Fnr family transcriptional regulator [Planctomycetota bacterium]|nr:Crp/Fnr family transcriptional regulator [Planctomycetota bacterium]